MWLFLLVPLVILHYGTGVDTIYRKTKEGQEVEVSCRVHPNSFWFRQRSDAQDQYMKNNKGVISLTLEYGGTEAFIKFHNPRFDDTGTYVYRNFNVLLKENHCQFNLSVLSRPHANCNSQELVVNEGQTGVVSLNCSAQGNPPPELRWSRVNANNTGVTDLNISGNTLKIHNVTRFASGEYICEVTNTEGVNECNIRLDVQFLPEVEVYETDIEIKEGEAATLMCKVTGNPLDPNNIIWTKGTTPDKLRSDYRYILEPDNSMIDTHYTAFLILKIMKEVMGGDMFDDYWCSLDGYGPDYREKVVVRETI